MRATGEIKALSDAEQDEFVAWMDTGIERGWVSNPTCITHEGLPVTEIEEKEWDDGYDPCSVGLRVWVE